MADISLGHSTTCRTTLTPPTEWEWSADLGGGVEGVSGHSSDDLQSLQDLRGVWSHHLQDVSESSQQACGQVTLATDKYMGISTYSTYCMPYMLQRQKTKNSNCSPVQCLCP